METGNEAEFGSEKPVFIGKFDEIGPVNGKQRFSREDPKEVDKIAFKNGASIQAQSFAMLVPASGTMSDKYYNTRNRFSA